MGRIIVSSALILLGGCAPTTPYVSSFAGVRPTKPQEAAHHECHAFSRSDIKKDFHHQYTACMAKYGWKVVYK